MTTNNFIIDNLRHKKDFAGVFEFDGETGYFYLYKLPKSIINQMHIFSNLRLEKEDIKIKWNDTEDIVGIFIKDKLWGIFDIKNNLKYGGNYEENSQPSIPKNFVFT